MSPSILVRFFKEGGAIRPLKVPKALNPRDISIPQRPPNVGKNNTSATLGRQTLTQAKASPLPGTL